jgi:hypothetical protein
LLDGLTTRKGYAFQYMFLARPQQFLGYGIIGDFGTMKRMRSLVPTADTTEIASLEKHQGA